MKHEPQAEPRTPPARPPRKPYSAPVLEQYGDVRDLTLGGTRKGLADSINTRTKI